MQQSLGFASSILVVLHIMLFMQWFRSASLLFGNMTGEIWITPGQEPTQGAAYREKQREKGESSIAVVLGT